MYVFMYIHIYIHIYVCTLHYLTHIHDLTVEIQFIAQESAITTNVELSIYSTYTQWSFIVTYSTFSQGSAITTYCKWRNILYTNSA